jgi:hypothetical protein
MSEQLNHVDRALKKAEQAEQAGDKAEALKWLGVAERLEQGFKDIKQMDMDRKKNKNQRGGFNA